MQKSKYGFNEKEMELIQQSHLAFRSDEEQYAYSRQRMERIISMVK